MTTEIPTASSDTPDLVERARHMDMLVAIREGFASAEGGELKPTEQVYTEIKAKHDIPD